MYSSVVEKLLTQTKGCLVKKRGWLFSEVFNDGPFPSTIQVLEGATGKFIPVLDFINTFPSDKIVWKN